MFAFVFALRPPRLLLDTGTSSTFFEGVFVGDFFLLAAAFDAGFFSFAVPLFRLRLFARGGFGIGRWIHRRSPVHHNELVKGSIWIALTSNEPVGVALGVIANRLDALLTKSVVQEAVKE
jgi:hypothetical protein